MHAHAHASVGHGWRQQMVAVHVDADVRWYETAAAPTWRARRPQSTAVTGRLVAVHAADSRP